MGDFSSDSTGSNNNYGGKYKLPDFRIDANKIVRQPEYIPYNQKRGRDILSRVSFNTGVLWLSGFTIGGFIGSYRGYQQAPHPAFKVKMNSVLNGMSKYGSSYGSFLGVAAFLHTVSLWAADQVEGRLPSVLQTEQFSIIMSGAIPGALMFAHRGPRATALAAVLGSGITWTYYTALPKLFPEGKSGPRF